MLVYRQVCSVCGLRAGFHMVVVEPDGEKGSVLADGESKASSLDEYEHDGDEDGDINTSIATVIAPGVAVAIAKHAGDWEADGGLGTSNDDDVLYALTPTCTDDTPTPTPPVPGSVDLIF